MKTRSMYRGIVLIAAALATVACQNELKEEYNEPKPGEKITMTIRATQGAASQTRTDYEDNLGITGIDNIAVKWEGGSTDGAPVEKIKVFGVDANELDYSVDFNSLPTASARTGRVSASKEPLMQRASTLPCILPITATTTLRFKPSTPPSQTRHKTAPSPWRTSKASTLWWDEQRQRARMINSHSATRPR